MTYRLLCDHADLIAGAVSVAGAAFALGSNASLPDVDADYVCQPTRAINFLEIHGDADTVVRHDDTLAIQTVPSKVTVLRFLICHLQVRYSGGTFRPGVSKNYPSAPGSVQQIARFNGCNFTFPELPPAHASATLDLVAPAGAETFMMRANGCLDGGATELWTMHNAQHVPRAWCCANAVAHDCTRCSERSKSSTRLMNHILDWLLAHKRE